MPNTIDGQYILYVLLIFSFLSDIFPEKIHTFAITKDLDDLGNFKVVKG